MRLRFFNFIRALFSRDKQLTRSIRNIFGFYPGNIHIYKLAFRHRSAAQEHPSGTRISNERLEYLGDAILSAVVADYLFKTFPLKEEGFLTEMRSKIVGRAPLNRLSQKLGLDRLLMVSQELNGHGRSLNGDAFEAFLGAVYLDKGYNFTRKLIVDRIIGCHFDIESLETLETNYKSKLIEWSQKEKKQLEFNVVQEIGNGYNKLYQVEVLVEKVAYASGQDHSIKGAEQVAAEKAFTKILTEHQATA